MREMSLSAKEFNELVDAAKVKDDVKLLKKLTIKILAQQTIVGGEKGKEKEKEVVEEQEEQEQEGERRE